MRASAAASVCCNSPSLSPFPSSTANYKTIWHRRNFCVACAATPAAAGTKARYQELMSRPRVLSSRVKIRRRLRESLIPSPQMVLAKHAAIVRQSCFVPFHCRLSDWFDSREMTAKRLLVLISLFSFPECVPRPFLFITCTYRGTAGGIS